MPAKLRLNLLGIPEVYLDEQPIPFKTRKSHALLFYLVCNPGPQPRDVVAELLWPDMPTRQSLKNLRDGLTQLRAAVGDYITASIQRVEFNRQLPYEFDVELFSSGVTQAQATLDLAKLQDALNLYRGDFLLGFHVQNAQPFDEWLLQQREELYIQAISGLEWLAEQYCHQHEYNAALTVNRRLLKLEPWRESAHRLQMQLLAFSGHNSDALAHYKICQRVLLEELDVQPTAETVALYEQIRGGEFAPHTVEPQGVKLNQRSEEQTLHAPAPIPATTPAVALHNLPRQMTPLIGRQSEITLLSNKLLDPSYPLLTLSGAGGIGKSRLAVAVAETVCAQFPDGVWFVPLANISPKGDVINQLVTAIGEVLQITFAGAEPLVNQLFSRLRHKQLLLILDNFEHLLAHADFVLNLLQSTRSVKILLTTRRRLNFQAEFFFQVEGLAIPDDSAITDDDDDDHDHDHVLDPQALLSYDSITLFVERARRVRPSFTLTQENQVAIQQICQLVAGLPLGIELAAAQSRLLSCSEIATMVRHTYRELRAVLPDLPERHRSLQAIMDASWQLLSAPEAKLLARCSVFRGDFTIDAAQAIAEATPVLLASLEDHSLLQRNAAARFQVHELVRQYAAEQLQLFPDDAQQVYARYNSYYTALLARLEQGQTQDQAAQFAIRADLDNIRAAWLWAVEQGRVAELASAVKGLSRFYYLTGFLSEAVNMLMPAVARVRAIRNGQSQPAPEVQSLLARLLLEKAFFDAMLDRRTLAEQSIQEAILLAQTLVDPALEALAHLRLGDIAWSRADYHLHRTAYGHSLALVRQTHQLSLEAHCLSNLGMNHDQYGEYSEAIACYEDALAIARQLGNRLQENIVYNNLGVSYSMLGDLGQTLHYYQQALQLSHELDDQEGLGFAHLNLGRLWCTLGEDERAQSALSQALTRFRAMKLTRLETKTLLAFIQLYQQRGDYEQAQATCEQALALAQRGGYPMLQADVLVFLGYLLTAKGVFSAAREAFNTAQNLWQPSSQRSGRLLLKAGLAQLYLRQNYYIDAQAVVEEILATLDTVCLDATQRPGLVFWICYQTLVANRDARATKVLQRGCQMLQTQAATLADAALQHTFLQKITAHRELMSALAQYNP